MIYGVKHCECGHKYISDKLRCPKCGVPEAFADMKFFDKRDWIYDLESYPNIFTAYFIHPLTNTRLLFEISDRKNEFFELVEFLFALETTGCRGVGYNNNGYDYPIIHFIMESQNYQLTHDDIYTKSMSIINTPWERRFDNRVAPWKIRIPQIDLYQIHHFDNKARRTSLKLLEFNMRMETIEDLPYPVGSILNDSQKDVLISYNEHDVIATLDFYVETIPMIEFREELSEKYERNFLNHNDTKIGKDYFIMKLEGAIPGSCYTPDRKPRQTRRPAIALKDVIFPYINFEHPEFQRIRDYLASVVINEKTATDELLLKGVFKDVNCTVDGFTFDFGSGGIHGSVSSRIVYADDDYMIEDWDVASYYPNLAIANRLYPEHLSDQFCDIYKDVFNQRRQFKKGTVENAMLKLALNGVYGDSNNKYSPFYDPQYTMSITINGQLLLCLLAQFLMRVSGLQMIQINTDGLTVRYPRAYKDYVHQVCKWWESFTLLELENVEYSRMFVRDVNNYIGEYTDGKVKRKGAYEYKVEWHKDHSALIVPKAAEAVLVHGADLKTFIHTHTDDFDFMLRAKVGRADNLMFNGTTELQRISRFYVAKQGGSLVKVSPPAKGYKVGQWRRANNLSDAYYHGVCAELRNRPSGDAHTDVLGMPWDERIHTKSMSKYGTRNTSICKGYLVSICNDVKDFDRSNLNFDYYINEAEKLIKVLTD